jgi:hypothetical protein
LDVEFLAGHQVEAREGGLQHRFEILFEITSQRRDPRRDGGGQAAGKVVDEARIHRRAGLAGDGRTLADAEIQGCSERHWLGMPRSRRFMSIACATGGRAALFCPSLKHRR